MPPKVSGNPGSDLSQLKLDQLKEICRDLEISVYGTKAELASRILEKVPYYSVTMFEDNAKEEERSSGEEEDEEVMTPRQMMAVMMGLMREQRQQSSNLMKLLSDRRDGSAMRSHGSSDSINQLGSDPRLIRERLIRQMSEVKGKLSRLSGNVASKVAVTACQASLLALERSEDRLEVLFGEKIDLLSPEDSQTITEQYNALREDVNLKRNEALVYCQCREEQDRAGGLPPGLRPTEFLGDPNDFPSWLETFEVVVHDNPRIAPFYKYQYLRQSLKGAASRCLDGFSPSVEHYDSALEHVKARFGQPRKVVRHLMKSFVEMDALTSEDAQEIRSHYDQLQGKLISIDRYSAKLENPQDAILLPILESKLTPRLKEAWERELVEKYNDDEFATVKIFSAWYQKQVRSRETGQDIPPNQLKRTVQKEKVSSRWPKMSSAQALSLRVTSQAELKCSVCNGGHGVEACKQFAKEQVPKRWEIAREKGLCFRCLRNFQPAHNCKVSCGTGCGRRHHRLLHRDFKEESAVVPSHGTGSTTVGDRPSDELLVLNSYIGKRKSGTTILPTALAYLHGVNHEPVLVNVAFDTMCQDTFISQRLSQLMNLPTKANLKISVHGFGDSSTVMETRRVDVGLSRFKNSHVFRVDALVKRDRICSHLEPTDVDWHLCTHLKHLDLSHSSLSQGGEVDLLIGLNHYLKLVEGTIIRHPKREDLPSALKTVFGFIIFGPNERQSTKRSVNCMITGVENADLDAKLERFWTLDSLGTISEKRLYTQPEREALKIFENSIRCEGRRYMVSLPFKPNCPYLKSDFFAVKKQLIAIENRLMKDENQKEAYQKAMDDYVKLGFARPATQEELILFQSGPEYIIPHHPVVRPDCVSTKTRIVFNASAKDPHGYSLNDCLLPGPALQPDLGHVLLRFRTRRVALLGDIAKMFCQTMIEPKHYRYHQYLWRNFDQSREPTRFIMTRVMFGVTPSPFLAMGSVLHHSKSAEMNKLFPEACAAVQQDMYVDDYCGGGDTDEETVNLCRQMLSLLKLGGWTLTKFASNSSVVMSSIPSEDRLLDKLVELEDRQNGLTKALGIGWDVHADTFQFKVDEDLQSLLVKYTKRTILSKVSKVFDILGFYTAFTIRAKVIIQELWLSQCGWDQELNDETVMAFRRWEEELKMLYKIKIPRVVLPYGRNSACLQMHVFSDASVRAYAAGVYLRSEDHEGHVQIHLLISKARVAPLKQRSVPRLELLAAHLGSKLAAYALEALKMKFDRVQFWTDSEIVLCWINRPSSNWKIFVANRVQDIHDVSEAGQWNHVSGDDNPADVMSRGASIKDLESNKLYWHGPEWLSRSENHWPKKKQFGELPIEAEMEASRKTLVLCSTSCTQPLFHRFETYSKTLRVFTHMMKWLKKVPTVLPGALTAEQLLVAEKLLLRLIQMSSFQEELRHLEAGLDISKNNRLASLDPRLSLESGLLEVGGRLNFSRYADEFKHQVILPARHVLVHKLIMHYHVKHCHAGPETTLACLRQRYWILCGRREVTKVIHGCLNCRHQKTVPIEQKMAPLPPERTDLAPAFTSVGLDFTGPLFIRGNNLMSACLQGLMIKGSCNLLSFVPNGRVVSLLLLHLSSGKSSETVSLWPGFPTQSTKEGVHLHLHLNSESNGTFRNCDRHDDVRISASIATHDQ